MRLETVRASCVGCAKTNIKTAGKHQQVHRDRAHAHHRSRQRYIIGLSPRSKQRYDDARNREGSFDRTLGGLGVGTQRYFEYV